MQEIKLYKSVGKAKILIVVCSIFVFTLEASKKIAAGQSDGLSAGGYFYAGTPNYNDYKKVHHINVIDFF